MRTRAVLLTHFEDRLAEWQAERNDRPEIVPCPWAGGKGWTSGGTIAAWALYELENLRAEINRLRAKDGKDPVTQVQVADADLSCLGHVDYTHKLALRAADMVLS
jgi:hypothetical protein